MAMTFSSAEALEVLCKSVPEWKARLDELNGQIAERQLELARLTEQARPPTRSLKNKGSTESLRPRDGEEKPFVVQDLGNAGDIQMNPFESSKAPENGSAHPPRSSVAPGRAAIASPPPPKASSNPRPSPGAGLARQSSQPTPASQPRPNPAVLRKRKTESLASGESLVPKYRTRSMIIVYYDSAVQTAFEDLVKFVSGSRNAMRKGKMAAKMAEMRRAAELEIDPDEDEEEADSKLDILVKSNRALLRTQKKVPVNAQGQISTPDSDSGNADLALPKLNFISTRQMGPLRDHSRSGDISGSAFSVGLLRGYRRAGQESLPDIFDELDKGLEWCQGQCEHAAHQFLRDGDCSTEIDNIKRKLEEVKTSAEKEVERIKQVEATSPKLPGLRTPEAFDESRGRVLKAPMIRKELGMGTMKDLEVDDNMEVDDGEDEEEMEVPPKLIFKRSRDIGL